MTHETHLLRMKGLLRSLDGLSVGDAFGEQFFGPPGHASQRIEARTLPAAPWRWTDDTAMALGIREVLELHQRVDQDALAQIFARRFMEDRFRGYGAKAQQILELIAEGRHWSSAARVPFRDGSKGNGAAMRVGPLGAYFSDDLARVIREARASAEITHAHPEGIQGAIAVALAAAWAVRAEASLFELVLSHLEPSEVRRRVEQAASFSRGTQVWQAATRLGAGEQVLAEDTVPFSPWCAASFSESFEEAMWATVSALGDRDTTCAIVGSIVGLRAPVPAAWLQSRSRL